MTKLRNWMSAALIAAALAACGGGGGGGDAGLVVTASVPPVTGSPTGAISASAQSTADLVAAAKAGATAANTVNGFSSLPLGVQVTLPTGVVTTNTFPCPNGGSYVLTDNTANPTTTSVGDTEKLVFSNCAELGFTFNGTFDLTATRFAGPNDFGASFVVTNMSVAQSGASHGPFSFTGQIDIHAGNITYAFAVNGHSVVGTVVVTYSGNTVTIASATTRSNLTTSSGFVEVHFSNWVFDANTGRPTSGTANVFAANGDTAMIVVQSDGYHVTVNVAGVTTSSVVGF
jgi:hypothetical protein